MIRPARATDLAQILSIYQSHALDRSRLKDLQYIAEIEHEGFLLGLDTKTDYTQLIASAPFFYVFEEANEIVGYIAAQVEHEYADNEFKIWLNKELREVYYNNPQSISLTELAVKKSHINQGVASQLLAHMELELIKAAYQYLFSVVTTSPVTNQASLSFHQNHGFQAVCKGKPTSLFNLDNYSSVLWGTNLSNHQ